PYPSSSFLFLLYFTSNFSLPPTTSPIFFFNDTATTEIYTLSLHDALPILGNHPQHRQVFGQPRREWVPPVQRDLWPGVRLWKHEDRKSTRLNSSHGSISYAVFCLKKKTKTKQQNNAVKTQQENTYNYNIVH